MNNFQISETNFLVFTDNLDQFSTRIKEVSSHTLFNTYLTLQKNYSNWETATPKCILIIEIIGDERLLKDMVISSKNYLCIGEALSRIQNIIHLNEIKRKRKDLSLHVNSRKSFLPNALKFIAGGEDD